MMITDPSHLPIDKCKLDEIPTDHMMCPIGFIFMRLPVKTLCGHIFEKICLDDWLERQTTCPLDRREIKKVDLVLQESLQKEIMAYIRDHPEEDDKKDYEALLLTYKKEAKTLSFSQSIRIRLSQHHWRMTLQRVNRLAITCVIFSGLALVGMTYGSKDSLSLIKEATFYLLCGNLGLSGITSSSFINCLIPLENREERLVHEV